ncbi:MAG: hypothetical protein JWM76_3953 [Pseudonocardiales bacterium]|nr:hypothetical protein [Pseudonocardiales bacterium]
MELKTGTKLRSQVGPTEVVVVKAPPGDVTLTCGGQPMVLSTEIPEAGLTPDPSAQEQLQIGKRYTDADATIEVLVTKPGAGTLVIGGAVLELKQAKPLPASD